MKRDQQEEQPELMALRQACLLVVDRIERLAGLEPRTAWLRQMWREGKLVTNPRFQVPADRSRAEVGS